MFTEDGTIVVEIDDLVDWAVQNYKSVLASQLMKMYQAKKGIEQLK